MLHTSCSTSCPNDLKYSVITLFHQGIHIFVLTLCLSVLINSTYCMEGFAQSVSVKDISIVDHDSVHVPDEYEVEEGDTLWLISQEFFQDPWLWPNLWALNPHITNPHWIYPGDVIRLKWSPRSQQNAEDDLNLKPVGYSADLKKVVQKVINKGMIVEKQDPGIGVLVASPEAKTYLATGDVAYIKVGDVNRLQLNQKLSIYRPTKKVLHPDLKEIVGQKVLLVGTIEVIAKGRNNKLAKVKIIQAHQEIERGDLIVTEVPPLVEVNPVKNLVDLEGVILDGLQDFSEFAQYHVIFLDVGKKDGVQVGNRLSVVRQGDGLLNFEEEEDQAMPIEAIGEVLVIATQQKTSTALITRSKIELRKGDQVLMLRNY